MPIKSMNAKYSEKKKKKTLNCRVIESIALCGVSIITGLNEKVELEMG